jgi:glycosyltransferase involved in cell wall biosynthesis
MHKIGFEAKRAFHNFRGLGSYARTLLAGLENYSPENEYYLFTPAYKDQRALNWARLHPRLNVITPDSVFGNSLPSFWRTFSVAGEVQKRKLDLFHGLSQEVPFAELGPRTKLVVTIHDLLYLKFPHYFSVIDRNIYRSKVNRAVERSDLILAICEQTRRDLIDNLNVDPAKIRVCYQSCDPQFYVQKSSEDCSLFLKRYDLQYKNFLLYVGAFEENKNALTLIQAMKHIPDAPMLVLIGKGKSYLKRIIDEGKDLLQKKRLLILQDIGYEELPYFYRSAMAFCFPSFYEGFGIPIIESLYQGTPVLTSKGGVFPEAAGPGALYSDPRNWEEWRASISRLLNDPLLRQQLAQEGYQHVQKFHLKTTTENLVGHYRDIISRS